MDWDALERRDFDRKDQASFAIPVKKVAVPADKVRRLPDGTIVIKESDVLPEEGKK